MGVAIACNRKSKQMNMSSTPDNTNLISHIIYKSEKREFNYYSLVRYAIADSLKILKVGKGDFVLTPEYICRDILSSINSVGASPVYYKINRDLLPENPELWPDAKVIIAVNYFGFPQPLEEFEKYSKKTGAVVIEDNAHGFLSKDEEGRWLGLRTDVGIFNFRKTLNVSDGAGLIINKDAEYKLPDQKKFIGNGFSKSIKMKLRIKRIPIFGLRILGIAVNLTRFIRKVRTGSEIPPSSKDAEIFIPYMPEPNRDLLKDLSNLKENNEIKRRKELYRKVHKWSLPYDLEPVFNEIPDGAVLQGFPFRADDKTAIAFGVEMRKYGLDTSKWPELPDLIAQKAPDHYKDVWIVNFL